MKLALPTLLLLAVQIPCLATESVSVPGERLVAIAQARLQELAGKVSAEWEFVPSNTVLSSVVSSSGELSIEAGQIGGQWPRSRVGVPVVIRVDGVVVQNRILWFTAYAWRQGQVYVRDQQSGDPADSLELRAQRIDVAASGGKDSVEFVPALLQGQRLLRSVRAGQPALAHDFGPMPVVARNTYVDLRVRKDGVALSTRALARNDGVIGDRVQVLPSGATQWIDAAVIGRNEVMVEN